MKKSSLLATLPIAAATAITAGLGIVPNTSAIDPSSPICSTDVTSDIKFSQALSNNCPTIQLYGTININTTPEINYAVAIDLNGNTINGGSNTALNISGASADVSITDSKGTGKVTSANSTSTGTITVRGGASLSINGGATIENTAETEYNTSVTIVNNASSLIVNEGATITGENGIGLNEAAKITMNGGTITGTKSGAIYSSGMGVMIAIRGGSIRGAYDAVNVYDAYDSGSENKIDISGGNIEAGGNGITLAAPGTVTMTGGTVKGMTGIEVALDGIADIKGGHIIADGAGASEVNANVAGVAIIVDDEEGSQSRATISAPTVISATNQNPVLLMNEDWEPDLSNASNKIIINAGVEFTGTRPALAYLAPGLTVAPNGVVMTTAEAEAMGSTTNQPATSTDDETNPNTADPIALYVAVAVAAILGLGATAYFAKKNLR